jgi:hypothetical protein
MRVLVERREGLVRNVLNLAQLLEDCRDGEALNGGVRVACRAFTFSGDLAR